MSLYISSPFIPLKIEIEQEHFFIHTPLILPLRQVEDEIVEQFRRENDWYEQTASYCSYVPPFYQLEMSDYEISEDEYIQDAILNTSGTTASEDSEYETLEEDNGNDNHSYGSDRSSRSRHSLRSLEEGELSDSIIIEDEREDGDGEEESSIAKDKKLDDDEDRRNPQYIPKKGTFYEHDDRTTLEELGTEEDQTERPSSEDKSDDKVKETKQTGKKGKVWTEKADRWSHDLYVEDDQKPKSTQELIDTYGYDIRNEDAPPKARRRRRYGRGPNKYTRNWEDVDAYNRPSGGSTPRKPFQNNREEFPDLNEKRPRSKSRDKRRGRGSERKSQSSFSSSNSQTQHVNTKVVDKLADRERRSGPASDMSNSKKEDSSRTQSELNGFVTTGVYVESNVPNARGGIGRGFRGRGRPTMEFIPSRGRGRRISPPFENAPGVQGDSLKHAADMLSTDFAHMFVSNGNNANTSGSNSGVLEDNRGERQIPLIQQEIPPRMQDNMGASSNRSKRYSTQRQRSLPESAQPPAYTMGYYGPSPQMEGYPPGPVYNEGGVPVPPPPVTSPPMQMVTFLPPGPPPPPGPAPPYPPPPIINYVTPPPYALPIPPPNAPAEIFQGQGGITYYNAQSQAVVPRQTPPRRVKLAIPIVPPPEKAPRGRGRNRESNSPPAQGQQEVNIAAS